MATAEQTVTTKDVLNAIGAFKERTGLHATLPELANSLGVNVATVREAVHALVENGNVRYSGASGQVYVKKRPYPPKSKRRPAPSTMPTEAPERPQEATDAPAQGVGPTEQAPEQAQEPGIIGGVATEGEGQSEGAEEQERRHGAMLNITEDDEDEHPAQALEQAAKQWRDRRMGRLVLVLSEEIGDDATLGRLVRRLIREGVA